MKSFDEYTWPMKHGKKPFAHQKQTVEFLLRNKRSYILSDIGTGKTLCPLWMADILMHFGKIKKVLVITPLSTLKVVWANEIFTHLPHRTYAVAHGSPDKRLAAIRSTADFVLINHDGIKSMENEIIAEGFDIIVIDELTAYKNATADRSKAMQRISKKARAVIGMTGAPTPNRPSEAFGQAKVVNPDNPELPRYFTQFVNKVEIEVAPYVWVARPDAANTVFKVLQPSVRFTRDQCLDIPPVFNVDVALEMSSDQLVAYKAVRDECLYELANDMITVDNAAVKFIKLLQISAGSVKGDDGSIIHLNIDNKINDILEQFEESGRDKMIVVSAFRASVERLHQVFSAKGVKCSYIHGGINSNLRSNILDSFQKGDLEILVVQPQAVAHGVTLTACNNITWQSYVTSGETWVQMNGRITRAGQERKQYVRRQFCSKAEEKLIDMLDNKIHLSGAVLKMFESGDF